MSFGNLQLALLTRMKKDYENFQKADSSRLKRSNYLQTRLVSLEKHMQMAERYNEEIVGAGRVEENLKAAELSDAFDQILEIYGEYKPDLLDAIGKLPPDVPVSIKTSEATANNENNEHGSKSSELRLPKINLPVFSGGYETWRSFHDLFVSLIHTNTSLADVQKLHYLKSSLSGEAERLLQHLAIDKDNYLRAWDILKERYDHKRVLVNVQLKLLFGQKVLTSDTATNIKGILDTSQEIIHALENLGLPVSYWDAIVIFIILQKLTPHTQQLWEERLGVSKELPMFKDFVEFLECRFQSLEAVEQQAGTGKSGQGKSVSHQVLHIQQVPKKNFNCRLCQQGQHALKECRRFLQMDVNGRRQAVHSVKVCENCLAYSHFKRRCPSGKCCYFCKQRHHSLLHDDTHNSRQTSQTLPLPTQTYPHPSTNFVQSAQQAPPTATQVYNPNASEFQQGRTQTNSFHLNADSQVLLATALINVKTSGGDFLMMRALIDPGSEASFVTESAIQRLKLKTKRTFVNISGLGLVSSGTAHRVADLEFKSVTSAFTGTMRALLLRSLTGLLPAQRITIDKWSHLENLQLADPTFHQPSKIDMLLGSDVYSEIVLGDVVRPQECKGPIAQKTHLGWILLGKLGTTQIRSFSSRINLDAALRRFWEMEEQPNERCEAEEDKRCEEHFMNTTKRLRDGRYKVRLPFREGHYPSMGPTRNGAVRRFIHLEKRLQANTELREAYIKCMSEYIKLGHMTPVKDNDTVLKSPFHFFIPHHAVFKESSTTTKLRVVFDATFKPSFGSSLNDMLMVGPKTQTDAIDVVLRWRRYKFTFTGDIEKMYRQIRVDERDANYQLILWRENPQESLKTYRLNTVTFGTASAPFLAIRVLLKLADDEAHNFPAAASVIREETYVDDVISGADTLEEAQHKLKTVRELLATAGFQLRKHVSNSMAVLQHIPPEQRAVDFSLPFDEANTTKTLGLKWEAVLPEQPTSLETQEEEQATRVHVCREGEKGIVDALLVRCSTLAKAIRTIAYCLRVSRITRRPWKDATHLQPEELETAHKKIIQAVQQTMFADEQENQRGYATLNPVKDTDGILRVGGRLALSNIPFNKKYPILLRSRHRIVALIIKDAHEKTLHGGYQKVTAYVRQKYWIPNLKSAVKKHLYQCTICFRFRAKPMMQQMANLPEARTKMSRPFTFSGVDYAGPIDTKTWRGRNAKTLKGYICIFVCMSTKAMHLEAVSDMTTQAFIAAFRRFSARRGLCKEIFSDCGTTFVGSDGELKRLMRGAKLEWKEVAEILANEGTQWNFIPPASPHFGGLWEAGVKSVKYHIKRVAGNQILTFEELTTLLVQIEACLNSRPLCPVSDDVTTYEAITPGHFLIGEPLIAPPQPSYQMEKISYIERWKRVQALTQSFWKIWSNEYLSRLQQRPKWSKIIRPQIMEGDLVLVKDERLPPLKWKLARVINLYPGKDNLVRVVRLKTQTAELTRPIAKICALPSNTHSGNIVERNNTLVQPRIN